MYRLFVEEANGDTGSVPVNSADRAICWLSFTEAPRPKHLSQIEGVHHAIPVEIGGTPLALSPATQQNRQVKGLIHADDLRVFLGLEPDETLVAVSPPEENETLEGVPPPPEP